MTRSSQAERRQLWVLVVVLLAAVLTSIVVLVLTDEDRREERARVEQQVQPVAEGCPEGDVDGLRTVLDATLVLTGTVRADQLAPAGTVLLEVGAVRLDDQPVGTVDREPGDVVRFDGVLPRETTTPIAVFLAPGGPGADRDRALLTVVDGRLYHGASGCALLTDAAMVRTIDRLVAAHRQLPDAPTPAPGPASDEAEDDLGERAAARTDALVAWIVELRSAGEADGAPSTPLDDALTS